MCGRNDGGVSRIIQTPAPASSRTGAGGSEAGKAAVAAGVTVVLWASSFVAIRDIGHSLAPAPMALLRLAVAAAALTVIMAASRGRALRLPASGRSIVL